MLVQISQVFCWSTFILSKNVMEVSWTFCSVRYVHNCCEVISDDALSELASSKLDKVMELFARYCSGLISYDMLSELHSCKKDKIMKMCAHVLPKH